MIRCLEYHFSTASRPSVFSVVPRFDGQVRKIAQIIALWHALAKTSGIRACCTRSKPILKYFSKLLCKFTRVNIHNHHRSPFQVAEPLFPVLEYCGFASR